MSDRKTEILDVATGLLQTRSFSSFSYQDLSDRLGITKASIHHHYPSKDDLGTAIAKRYHEQIRTFLENHRSKHDDPWNQFEGFVRLMADTMRCGNKICAIGSIQAELSVVPNPMRKETEAMVSYIINWIAAVLAQGRRQGVMAFPGKPQDQAALVFTAAQGALQYGRAQGEQKFKKVMKQIKETMKPHP